MRPIGVFDSGAGGQSVANAVATAFRNRQIILEEDKANLPYGTKTRDELLRLVMPKLEKLAGQGCEAIVIACNTVTTNIIEELRQRLAVPLIGMEPMVKPAAEQTRSRKIAVFATPATLNSQRYAWLKQTYASDVNVLEPDCSDWAFMIEAKQVEQQQIADTVNTVCDAGADVIVLGCTHYHWIEEMILKCTAGRAVVLQPEKPVILQLQKIIGDPAP